MVIVNKITSCKSFPVLSPTFQSHMSAATYTAMMGSNLFCLFSILEHFSVIISMVFNSMLFVLDQVYSNYYLNIKNKETLQRTVLQDVINCNQFIAKKQLFFTDLINSSDILFFYLVGNGISMVVL